MEQINNGQVIPAFVGLGMLDFLAWHLSASGDDYDDEKCWVVVPEL